MTCVNCRSHLSRIGKLLGHAIGQPAGSPLPLAVASTPRAVTLFTMSLDNSGRMLSKGRRTVWIADGEKYALVGLEVKLEGTPPPELIALNLRVPGAAKFDVPSE